ncbi:hypothetical protein ACFFX0_05040 [Citricoccus parietis]|uniref:Uncharacterized protein n=1 Tax=Citricoccus parietis TaxID=592307 RepID=A0ABV5FWC5_9MICC
MRDRYPNEASATPRIQDRNSNAASRTARMREVSIRLRWGLGPGGRESR